MSNFVIIGAGQAGCSLAVALRNGGFDGAITLIGEEPHPPYQRPPLSKAYLLGDMALERLFLRPEAFYADNGIELRIATGVTGIDRTGKRVLLDGDALPYDKLALCTGARPRALPAAIGGALGGVHTVRTLADIDALAPQASAGKRVLIVGGGYIGLEAAAVCTKLGLQVTLVEMAPRILQRVAAPDTAAYFRTLHQTHGVDLREGVGLTRLLGQDHVTGAELDDGTRLDLDLVIVGIGVAPATALADAAGLAIDNGIAVSDTGQTSDPDIYAAGDCTSLPYRGHRIRLESVQNAIDQAETVAENMMGTAKPYRPQPWFWSDQYDVKLQIAGLNTGYTRVITRPGDKDGALSHWYYDTDTLLAVDAMNDPRAYMIGKRLIEAGKSPDPALVADQGANLMAALKP